MPDISSLDFETQAYFQSLPPFVQESIMQSGFVIRNKQDLMRCAQTILGAREDSPHSFQ